MREIIPYGKGALDAAPRKKMFNFFVKNLEKFLLTRYHTKALNNLSCGYAVISTEGRNLPSNFWKDFSPRSGSK